MREALWPDAMLARDADRDRKAIEPEGQETKAPADPARQRKIIHIDMDAFFASVEQRDNPELRGKPVAVGGSRERGVVAAASYEARTFGVRSAMPSVTAKRRCQELIFVMPRFDVYKAVSLQIREIFAEYTPIIEPLSLDEAYLDVTENLKGIALATEIAEDIRTKIRRSRSAHDVHLSHDLHREARWHAGCRALRAQRLVCWPSDEHTVEPAATCLFQRRGGPISPRPFRATTLGYCQFPRLLSLAVIPSSGPALLIPITESAWRSTSSSTLSERAVSGRRKDRQN
jgi:impB/mucB/samB family